MKKRILTATILLGLATPALAASPFDGTWKIDMKSAKLADTPDVFVIKGGMFSCTSCKPAVMVKANGEFQPVSGHPYYDELAVQIVDPHTVTNSFKKAGKVTGIQTSTASADGKLLDVSYKDMSAPTGEPIENKIQESRVGMMPAGAHPVSGTWKVVPGTGTASDNGLIIIISVVGKMLHFSTPTGVSYVAPIGGGPVPIKGDLGGTMAQVMMKGPRTVIETDTIKGKVQGTTSVTVNPGGKTETVVVTDMIHGGSSTYTLTKE